MKQSIRRICVLILYYLNFIKKDKTRFLLFLLWPLLDFLIWGFTGVYVQKEALSQLLFSLVSGYIVWGLLWQTQQEVAGQFMKDVYMGSIHNIFASPVSLFELVISLFVSTVIKVLFSGGILIITAQLLYHVSIFILPAWFFIWSILLLLLFGASLGFISIGLVLRFGYRFESLTHTLPFYFWPFLCVFYPRSILPSFLQTISYVFAPSYVFEQIRNIIFSGLIQNSDLYTATFLSITGLLLSCIFLWFMMFLSKKKGILIHL